MSDTWGKLRREDQVQPDAPVVEWHPLVDHCADVAAVLVTLLGWRDQGGLMPSLWRQRLAKLGGQDDLDVVQVARLGVLAVFHDVGKVNHGFQAKRQADRRQWAGHVSEAIAVFPGSGSMPWCDRFAQAIGLADMAAWGHGDGVVELLAASVSHHGRPAEASKIHGNESARLWQRSEARDPFAALAEMRAAAERWLPSAWLAGGSPLPATAAFQHGFCGLIQLADWLGSDTGIFPYAEMEEGDRWPRSLRAAEKSLNLSGLAVSDVQRDLAAHAGFAQLAPGHQPRPMQQAVGNLSQSIAPGPLPPTLTLIEEETGGGKTEAAFWHFLKLFANGAVDGMFMALPTRTAATQLYERVKALRDRCFPDPMSQPVVIQAVPGYLGADGVEGRRMAPFDVLWPDDASAPMRQRRWAAEAPKRYLAGTIVVGTIDQALLAALAVNHAHLRSACLLRHLLVVDEVHASDAYMTRLLAELLRRQRQAGGHALLMSATLGASARDHLLAGWNSGANGKPVATRTTLSAALAMPYPLLQRLGEGMAVLEPVATAGRDRRVELATAAADDLAAIISAAIAAAAAGARVLIIRNTVRDCLATQAELERQTQPTATLCWRVPSPGGLVPVAHHARYARADRQHLDREIEKAFGKAAARPGGMIACATQTVQQALDLDADRMITDLCPVDVLLQRIGRLHRHLRSRPEGCATPMVTVLVPPDSFAPWLKARRGPHGWGGAENVYPDLRVLEATRRLIVEGTWQIPHDNRRLVELGTHAEALDAIDPEEPGWATHGNAVTGRIFAQREQARLSLLPWSATFGDAAVCFPTGDLAPELTTRLGADDRRIELREPFMSPFGNMIRELTIPGRWCRGVGLDEEPVAYQEMNRTVLRLGPHRFVYDRLGLRPEQD